MKNRMKSMELFIKILYLKTTFMQILRSTLLAFQTTYWTKGKYGAIPALFHH